MKTSKFWCGLLGLGLSGALMATPASALTLNFTGATGVTGTVSFDFAADATNAPGGVVATVTLTNTTSGLLTSDLRGIFFNLASGVGYNGYFANDPTNPLMWYLGTGSLPPYGSFDLCGQTENSSTCNAGIPNSGLLAPPSSSDKFYLGLTSAAFGTNASQYETAFETLFRTDGNICLRYQAITGSKAGTSDKVCVFSPRPGDELPEPGTLALLGLGLLGLGASRRRKP